MGALPPTGDNMEKVRRGYHIGMAMICATVLIVMIFLIVTKQW